MTYVRRMTAMARLLTKPQQLRNHLCTLTDQAQSEVAFGPLFQKYQAYTMLPPQAFVLNLELVNAYRTVPGCVVECGVWRGGCLAAIAEVLGCERAYHAFDGFVGLPPVQEIDGPDAQRWQANSTAPGYHDNCSASREYVEQALRMAGVVKSCIHAGLFQDTLPDFRPVEPIAVLRLDGDWYDSTIVCLRRLFPLLAPGGLVIVDDYHTWDGCARAVHDYLAETKSAARIRQWRDVTAYLLAPPNGRQTDHA